MGKDLPSSFSSVTYGQEASTKMPSVTFVITEILHTRTKGACGKPPLVTATEGWEGGQLHKNLISITRNLSVTGGPRRSFQGTEQSRALQMWNPQELCKEAS